MNARSHERFEVEDVATVVRMTTKQLTALHHDDQRKVNSASTVKAQTTTAKTVPRRSALARMTELVTTVMRWVTLDGIVRRQEDLDDESLSQLKMMNILSQSLLLSL